MQKVSAALAIPVVDVHLVAWVINAGEAEEEGYSDEYKLEDLDVAGSDYVKQEGVADFRSAWEQMDESTELADSYGLGQRDSMQEAVEAVIAILGMQVPLSVPPATPYSCCAVHAGVGLQLLFCHRLHACTSVSYWVCMSNVLACSPTS